MAGEWTTVVLGEICEFRAGSVFKPGLQGQSSGSYPFVKVSDMNLSANAIRIQTANNWVSEDDLRELRARPLPPGTVVFAKIGEALRQNRLRQVVRETIVDNNMMGAVPHTARIDPCFFYYALSKFDFSDIAQGTALPYLTVSALSGLKLDVPPLTEQRAIAHILGTLDDKIELNRKMNRTLEAMAQAIFKSWFVDFDTIRAKVAGQQPAGLKPDLAALEDSELGEIPRGWKVGMIQDLGDVICGKTPPTSDNDNYGNDVPFVTIPDMHGKVFVTSTGKALSKKGAATQKNKFLPPLSICVSCIATPGLVALTSTSCQTNQQINSVVPSNPNTSLFCYFVLRGLGDRIRSHGAGGSVLLNLNKGQFSAMKVIVPPAKDSVAFQKIVLPIFKRILNNESYCEILASLRNALLPKLISGELRVPDAERIVGRCS